MSTVLLLPTVRNPRSISYSSPTLLSKSPKLKQTPSRLASPQPSTTSVGHAWLGNNAIFEIIQDHLVLKGYQLFAVEKWSVYFSRSLHRSPILPRVTQRTRSITTLAVYTGDSRHKVQFPPPPFSLELVLSGRDRLR
jgi:hypothetical protein